MNGDFELALRRDIEAGGVARQAIAENAATLPEPVRDDISLLVTELVTNAVLHGGAAANGSLQVEFMRRDGHVRVQVIDPETEFELAALASNRDSLGVWGLFLLDRIAERWGVRADDSGTCVWFELPAADSS
jgi:anti-sigma regulatory factor (Ser/Thr protein kinase)